MDNVLKYRIFVRNELSPKNDINREQSKYLAFLSPLIGDYIWQKDSFCLGIKSGSRDVPVHLYGETNFGDNIDDEWFIAYLLFELTKAFPQTCISITDTDGELLLIEAAHSLPKWLSPDTSKNRVFVCNGEVHIIPIPSNPGEVTVYPTGTPTVHQALQLVFGPHRTVAEERVQRAIRKRIQGFPRQSNEHFHHAHCLVPAEVKYILEVKPSLISPVVQAFCDRDPIDMKACRIVDEYPLKTRVMARIRFTRCLYAQLSQQPFKADRRSEWKIPAASDPLYKAHELGLKLACGVQILCGRSKLIRKHRDESQAVEEQDSDGAKWESFLDFLKEQNYFRGEVEGSKLYQDLLSRAKRQFKEDFAFDNSAKSTPRDVILGILNDARIEVDKMKEEELLPEDDDSWLNLTPEDLDKILAEYGDPSMIHDSSEHDGAEKRGKNTEIPVDLESVTRSMKSFVDKVSSYEGAEFPGDCDDSEDIQFDANSFMDAVGNLLEYRNETDEDSESDEEDLSDESTEEETEFNEGVQKDCTQDSGSEDGSEMASYMDQMDWELARTSIGQSFEKKRNLPVEPSGQNASCETAKAAASGKDNGETEAVDVDFNLVKNILESLSTQQGLAGPASNILGSMGIWLPSNTDST